MDGSQMDKKEYLLKLSEEGEFKRFTGNSERMFEILKESWSNRNCR